MRLVFTNTLASGAFGAPAPSYYTVTSADGKGIDSPVRAAFIVSGSPNVVELALEYALVEGALYNVSAEGTPALDTSTVPAGQFPFLFGKKPDTQANVEPIRQDLERLLYNIDLIFDGSDYEETPNGDLARVSGPPNVSKALWNAAVSNGLPWDPQFGGHAREYVDSPSAATGTLKGSVSAQILRDPRVKALRSSVATDDEKTTLTLKPTLISDADLEPVQFQVPNAV